MHFHHPQRSKYFQRWQLQWCNHGVNSSIINTVNQRKAFFTRLHTELHLGLSRNSQRGDTQFLSAGGMALSNPVDAFPLT